MTMSESLERRLIGARNCFGQLETNLSWVEFDSEKWIFETTSRSVLNSLDDAVSKGILRLLCAANKMYSIEFRVHITRKNRHPPQFSENEYRFYLPTSLKKLSTIGHVTVMDHDPVIYNSKIQLSVLNDSANLIFGIHQNGTITLIKDVSTLPIFKPIRYTLVAIDFGSPQLFSLANLTFIPVSVSEVKQISVNVAKTDYQIFEWDNPEHGIADKFIVSVSRNDMLLYRNEVDGANNIAFFEFPLQLGSGYSVTVTASDIDGETPSKPFHFSVINSELNCDGECWEGGGMPICYYGQFNRIVQYRDNRGPHCSCFNGYSGNICDIKERCAVETTIDVFGHVDWNELAVNETASIPCPFGAEGDYLKRKCLWDVASSRGMWQQLTKDETCRKQSSVLIHLGVIGNYATNANTVSGIETVYRFIDSLIKVPSFQPNITNVHFDVRIAEHVVQVFDAIINRRWQQIRGNTTLIKMRMFSLIEDFCGRLPIPYRLTSAGESVSMQTLQRLPDKHSYKWFISSDCSITLAPSTSIAPLRVICLRNSTLITDIDSANPILVIRSDNAVNDYQYVQIELKPHNDDINYTCVRYDQRCNSIIDPFQKSY
ncbi:unnamed protein product [Anisakis simplex]|uniref:EGF-like domain-containing protein n=1 Tax=Anisakis simplex TaxID=6269 RepID=A0A0M3JZ42_ANISI|nr:unnamed protein product [Anisakis simplex]